MNTKITFIPKIYKPSEVYETDLSVILNAIKYGVFNGIDMRGITQHIASWNDHNKQNELKYWNLPVVLYNGVFGYKNNESLKSYSSFTAMDFDMFESEAELQRIKYWLGQTLYVFAIFRTPSGRGLKAIVMHDNANPEYHEELYSHLLSAFKMPTTDASVSDVSRGNYLCYDPELWINEYCEPFHFVHDPNYTPKPQTKSVSRAGTNSDIKLLEFMLDLKVPVGKKSDKSIINILNAYWRKQPGRWKEGNRANSVFMSASELCNAGVKMSTAIDNLLNLYTPTGLETEEILYQSHRGYLCNAETYGSNRQRFDNYGSKKRS